MFGILGIYKRILRINTDIKHYYNEWIYDKNRDILFFNRSCNCEYTVFSVNFKERYIDYRGEILKLNLLHCFIIRLIIKYRSKYLLRVKND